MNKFFTVYVMLLFVAFVHAEEATSMNQLENLSISGNGNIMFGQVVSGYAFGKRGDNFINRPRWQNFYSGRINISSHPVEWFSTIICPEVGSAFPITTTSGIMKETYKLQYRALLQKAVGIFNWNWRAASLMVEVGQMEYSFNPDIKNLGNYMYRSSSYPLFLRTKLDYTYSNLMGIRPEVGLIDNRLKFGIIINSINYQAPFYDISIGEYITYNTPKKFLDVGFSICNDRIISVNDSLTDALSLIRQGQITDSSLTMRSMKFDLRLSLDFSRLREHRFAFWGPNGGKIYAEGALLGLKDPDYFPEDTMVTPSLLHRLPIMFGVNLPTWKILDVFSIELEYCKYPYAFDWWGNFASPSPVPPQTFDTTWQRNYREHDNLKWTIYLKKSISKFDVIAFFANDHMLYDTYSAEAQPNTEQSLRTRDDWHWYVKLQYNL